MRNVDFPVKPKLLNNCWTNFHLWWRPSPFSSFDHPSDIIPNFVRATIKLVCAENTILFYSFVIKKTTDIMHPMFVVDYQNIDKNLP